MSVLLSVQGKGLILVHGHCTHYRQGGWGLVLSVPKAGFTWCDSSSFLQLLLVTLYEMIPIRIL